MDRHGLRPLGPRAPWSTRRRVVSSLVVLLFYVPASPLAYAVLMSPDRSTDRCLYSGEGICSTSVWAFAVNLFLGGILVGLVCTVVALAGAKKAPGLVWSAALALAVLSPTLCTIVAWGTVLRR